MVTKTTTAATNLWVRTRPTMAVTLAAQGTTLPVVRQDYAVDRIAEPAVPADVCGGGTRVETIGFASAFSTPLGHRAWSPPS